MRDPAVPCREGKAAAGWEGAAGMPGTAPRLQLPAQAEQQTEFGSLRVAAFPEQGGNCPWNREGRDISLEVRFPWLQSQQGSTLPAGNRDEPLAPRSVSPPAAQGAIPPLSFAQIPARGKISTWMSQIIPNQSSPLPAEGIVPGGCPCSCRCPRKDGMRLLQLFPEPVTADWSNFPAERKAVKTPHGSREPRLQFLLQGSRDLSLV